MNLYEQEIPLEDERGKMGPLEGALRITYRGNDVQVWDED
jgi:hypothetical protein